MRSAGGIAPLIFTSEGSLYYGIRCIDDRSEIHIASLDMATGEFLSQPTRLPSVGSNSNPVWSSDGKKLAYVSRRLSTDGPGFAARSVLVIRSMEAGEESELDLKKDQTAFWTGTELGLGLEAWSPDGRSILCGAGNSWHPSDLSNVGQIELWRIPAEGGEPKKLRGMDLPLSLLRGLGISGTANFHPDGRVAFPKGSDAPIQQELWVMENLLTTFAADK